jgi:hypothetical protein
MRRRLQKESWKPGLINVKELLRDPQFDFLNVSLSPMHCQKGVYKDVILWTLEAVYKCCQNKTHFQRLLRAWDAAAVDQARAYLQGRCKSRGISGVLMASSIDGTKIGVRSSSKADLANAMKILRALLFFVHSEAFQALVEEKVEDGNGSGGGSGASCRSAVRMSSPLATSMATQLSAWQQRKATPTCSSSSSPELPRRAPTASRRL